MAKYNQKRKKQVVETTTHQGGRGYTQTKEKELIGILSTGIETNFYETESDREQRLKTLIDSLSKKNKEFVAKALVYARTVFGQRSVTHAGAVSLTPHLSGDSLGKRFFSKRNRKRNEGGIVYRLDDMLEILSLYILRNGDESAPIPNSIKKGFKIAIENADKYELAKYQGKNRDISLVDIVNLVHPRETDKQGVVTIPKEKYVKAIKGTKFQDKSFDVDDNGNVYIPTLRALVLGILTQYNTVEDKNTKAGEEVSRKVKEGEITQEEAEKELKEKKSQNYEKLIENREIGYLALLRNIRNIIETSGDNVVDKATELLVEENFIRKSLVWPHQIDLALEVIVDIYGESTNKRNVLKFIKALDEAYEKSVPNLNELLPEGKTAIVYDTSGSMQFTNAYSNKGSRINKSCVEKASLVAATLFKGVGGDVYQFGVVCIPIKGINPIDSINSIKKKLMEEVGNAGHGTYFHRILPTLGENRGTYDRVLIITDEQGADRIERSYNEYVRKYGTPYVYFINIAGYRPTMKKETPNVFRIYGYGADIYEKIKECEIDKDKVINEINEIKI